jgi:hypothetical protein
LLDLVSRVKCIPSEEAIGAEQELTLCDLEVVLKSGMRKAVRVEYHRGHWKNPMTDAGDRREVSSARAQASCSRSRRHPVASIVGAREHAERGSTAGADAGLTLRQVSRFWRG